MAQQEVVYAGMIVAYMIAILVLAMYIAKVWIDDPGDFMIAGRELGAWISGFSLLAILMSGGFVPAIVLFGYLNGIGGAWFYWGWVIGQGLVLLTWAVFWRRTGAYTPAEYFEFQYGVSGRLAVLFGSVVAMVMIASYQFVGAGVLIAGMIGIDVLTAVLIVGGFTIVYSLLSGMWGISISDFIQAVWVMTSVFVLVPLYLFLNHGAPTAASPNISAEMLSLPFGGMEVLSFAGGTVMTIVWLNWFLANSPYYWVRASATRSEKALKQGYIIALSFASVIAVLGAVIGLYAQMLVDPAEPGLAFGTLLAEETPLWLGGFAASGVIAATMSTVDIIYQGSVNTIVRDYVQRFTSVTDRGSLLQISRVTMVGIGLVTMSIALAYPGALDAFIAFAFSFVAPIVVLNFDSWFARYGTKEGAVVTILAIVPLVTYWEFFSPFAGDVHALWVSGAASITLFYGISGIVHVTGPWWRDSVMNAGDLVTGGADIDGESETIRGGD